jgi:hypothetical protein
MSPAGQRHSDQYPEANVSPIVVFFVDWLLFVQYFLFISAMFIDKAQSKSVVAPNI